MPNENDKQKLGADEHPSGQSLEKEAKEIGAASGYGGTTEILQQMRRGDETKGDPNERDVVGDTTAATDTENPPVPKHQNAPNEVAKNHIGKDKEE